VPHAKAGQDHRDRLPAWLSEDVDLTVPNVARGCDYFLGGYHNFAIDRDFAERVEQVSPGTRQAVYASRAFLGRAVRWLVGKGVRQFLDIGSGVPTLGNVHEVAEKMAAGVRVMYVDIDPITVAHARAILSGYPLVRVLQADLRRPMDIIDHPDVTDLLDLSEPVAVVLSMVLPFILDVDDPVAIVSQLRDAVVAGSYIVVSHMVKLAERAEEQKSIRQLTRQTTTPVQYRSRAQVARLFTGLDIVEPGIVPLTDWHPDSKVHAREASLLAAVGRKP
jgi:hypothetical protein